MQRHRVVVIGAGFGGLFAIKALRKADVDITLINGTGHHLFQPLLYQVATGILSEGEIAPPIREILKRQPNVDVRLGTVVGIDPASDDYKVVARWIGQGMPMGKDADPRIDVTHRDGVTRIDIRDDADVRPGDPTKDPGE